MTPKFRAWHKELEQMFYVGQIKFDVLNNNLKAALDGVAEWVHLSDIELLQWSGLYASGGVEIYDGDIMKMYADIEQEEFDYRRVYWSSIGINADIYVPWDTNLGLFAVVEGNIFENAELMNRSEE